MGGRDEGQRASWGASHHFVYRGFSVPAYGLSFISIATYSCGQAKSTNSVALDWELLTKIGLRIRIQRGLKRPNPLSAVFFHENWRPPKFWAESVPMYGNFCWPFEVPKGLELRPKC